ncbi:MAG: hypothetical protein KDB14_33675, partial [Planctomycetales bacterium]|nr:hypothetical protein [Planctomycetales bacterium]
MTDPQRLLAEANTTALERTVLRAGVDIEPPQGEKERAWAAILTQISPTGGTGGQPPTSPSGNASPATGAKAAGIGKAAALGAVVGLLVATGATVGSHGESAPRAQLRHAALPRLEVPVKAEAPTPTTAVEPVAAPSNSAHLVPPVPQRTAAAEVEPGAPEAPLSTSTG